LPLPTHTEEVEATVGGADFFFSFSTEGISIAISITEAPFCGVGLWNKWIVWLWMDGIKLKVAPEAGVKDK
jgi:hypothetical protein